MKNGRKLFDANHHSIAVENAEFHLFTFKTRENDIPVRRGSIDLLHIHTYYEIFACLEGELHIKTSEGEILLESGDIAIMPPDYMHTLIRGNGSSPKWISAGAKCELIKNQSQRNLHKEQRKIFRSTSPSVYKKQSALVADFFEIVNRVDKTDSLAPMLKFVMLAGELAKKNPTRYFQSIHLNEEKLLDASTREIDINRAVMLEQLINSHFLDPELCPEKTAAQLFVSRRHLDRIVRYRFGATFRELIDEKRISYAKELLLASSKSIEEISELSGYGSKGIFIRAFKKRHGISPSEFRRSEN